MKMVAGKVAVITGAASGIGYALAERCVQEGMKVVLADIEEQALLHASQQLSSSDAQILMIQTDVSKAGDVKALAQQTMVNYGAVHILFNNAGVGTMGSFIWENTSADWEWTMGVNLWGVIHGIRAFVPLMLEQNTECHIVNTASMAGLVSCPGLGIYGVTKHAVVALSETLFHELALKGTQVKVSVICPEFVNTRIMDAERNRPTVLRNDPSKEKRNPIGEAIMQSMRQAVQAGIPPQQIADLVFRAIHDETFYIITPPEMKRVIRVRMEDILQGHNPTLLPLQ